MIELSLTNAFMLYLGGTLLTLLIVWAIQNRMESKKKVLPLAQDLLLCEFCQSSYLAYRGKAVTKCPQCRCFNKRNV